LRWNSNSHPRSKAAQVPCSARLHAALDEVEHLVREGAHRALDLAAVGDHVGGLAGVDHGHRDHAGVDGPLVARDDGLEGLHHLAGHRHRVDAVVRHRRMRALAADGDLELVARLAKQGPGFSANCPTAMPGQLCAPKIASIGKRSNRPSLIISRAPPPPSSAGWNIR
jgi:hypothetical protein